MKWFIAFSLVVLLALGAPLSAGAAAGVGSYSTGPVVGSAPGAPMVAPAGWGRAGATLVYGQYRYLAYSHNDNRVEMLIVAYDRAGSIVGQWTKGGARYNHLGTVTVNAATRTVTWSGQGSVSATWSELQVYPTPTVSAASGPMPVPAGWGRGGSMLSWGGYRYMAYSHNDNRVEMLVVAYDALGNIVAQWTKGGARYNHLGTVVVDASARTITWTGQGVVSGTWEELFLYSTDVTPPVLSLPANVTAEATGPAGRPVTFSATAVDAGDGPTAVACSPASGSTFAIATTTVTCSVTDISGNKASGAFTVKVQDTTQPTLTGVATTSPNANGWYRGDVVIDWTAADSGSGVATQPADSVITGEGSNLSATKTVTDLAGNSRTTTVAGIKIDRTAPVTGVSAPSGWNTQGVTVVLSATDGLSGVAATYHSVNGGSTQAGTQITLTADGVYDVAFASVDLAGNVEATRVIQVKIDATDPTIGHTLSSLPNGAGWHNADVTVTFTCGDNLSGVATCTAPVLVSTEGLAQAVTGTAADVAGNSATDTATVNLDKTAPSIVASRSPAANARGWSNADVVVGFTCDDFGLSGISVCPAAVTLATEGAGQSASGTAVDNAGNSASATLSGISIDKTAPTTVATAPAAWQNGPVTVALAAIDALSGVAATKFSLNGGAEQAGTQVPLSAEGNHTVSYWSVDNADNAEAGKTIVVRIDLTDPTISAALSAQPNADGWHNADVTVTFTCDDALSGVASCPSAQTVATEGANQVVSGTTTDVAGNDASTSVTVNLDETLPTVTYTGNAGAYTIDQTVTITCAAADALSGVKSTTCANVNVAAYDLANGAGTYTYSATATDKAGNVGSGSVSFTVTVDASSVGIVIDTLISDSGVASSLGDQAEAIASAPTASAKAGKLKAFENHVDAQTGKKISPASAATLKKLAKQL